MESHVEFQRGILCRGGERRQEIEVGNHVEPGGNSTVQDRGRRQKDFVAVASAGSRKDL